MSRGDRQRLFPGRQQKGALPVRRRQERFKDEGAWQVDLVVAFFAVLLILLIVSIPRIASDVSDPVRLTYKSLDRSEPPFQLSSFAPVYPYLDRWVAKDGQLALLDLEAVARRYAEQGRPAMEKTIAGVDVDVVPDRNAIDGYDLKLGLFEKGIPGWLSQRRIGLDQTDEAARLVAASPRGVFIYVWADQRAAVARIVDELRRRGKPLRLELLEPKIDRVRIDRSAAGFTLEDVLRPY